MSGFNVSAINEDKIKISFTFDDGSTKDMPNYTLKEWNELLLSKLSKHNAKAVLFATGSRLEGTKGEYVLSSWDNAGHKIANHTFTHPYFSSDKVTLDQFKAELVKNDSIINQYSNYYPFFRFPYLKEGSTIEKRDGFREFLKRADYKNGHVTVDASDWYVNSRLIKRMKENSEADISGYRKFYVEHLYERVLYYDSLAHQLTGRRIPHTLLLHHNLTSALFLDDLIVFFKNKGIEIVDAYEAFKDPIYSEEPNILPAGESLIWALAKESGKFENVLRYPAEDSRYEKDKMDKLGL